jgi:hypothetical protein
MRFMILVKATKETEAGVTPEAGLAEPEKLMAEMATCHEELEKTGALLDASELQPSAKGWRIQYSQGKRTVIDGPFAETKELIASYTLIEVKSREETLDWASRYPNPAGKERTPRSKFANCSNLRILLPAKCSSASGTWGVKR